MRVIITVEENIPGTQEILQSSAVVTESMMTARESNNGWLLIRMVNHLKREIDLAIEEKLQNPK